MAGYDKNPVGALESLWNAKGHANPNIKQRLESVGFVDAAGNWVGGSNPKVAKQLINDLLSSTSGLPHGEVYVWRSHFASIINKADKTILPEAIVMDLKKQGIKYAELQGGLPEGLSYGEFRKILEQHGVEVRFLEKVSTKRLTSGEGKNEIDKKINKGEILSTEDKTNLAKVGENGVVGLDVAGPEGKEFTPAGMKRFELMYGELAGKAEKLDGALVFRIHAGEGYLVQGASGTSNHRDIAQSNVGHILDTIEGMAQQGTLSDKVIIRIGHATHASPAQLDRISLLEDKGVKIHVEANLTSNLVTGSVKNGEEQAQVLLRFLKHGVTPTLNTDGGGVMGTTLKEEYRLAGDIIDKFKENKLEITEGNIKYYSSELPSPKDRDPNFEYHLISKKDRDNFDMGQVESESRKYAKQVIPNLHK